jgi:serine/threonine protein phosphatase 1
MSTKIWAIGDIHGCYRELMALWKKLLKAGLDPDKDTVVFLGDYMDRGPDGRKVIAKLIQWKKSYKNFVFLYGNHEDILFDNLARNGALYGQYNWFANGGKTTYASYGGHFGKELPDGTFEAPKQPYFPKTHLDFLFKELVYTYETDKYVFVHAGLVPNASIEESKNFPQTLIWAREGFIDSDHDWGKKVIFGHSAAYHKRWGELGQPIIMKNKIGIDGAVCPPGNKNLIAVELPAEKFYFQESFNKMDFLTEMLLRNARDL